MRIALFTDTFLPQVNGVVTAILQLANGLADRGHHILIIAPYYSGHREFSHPNVRVLRVTGIPALFYEDFKLCNPFSSSAEKEIMRFAPQVLHFQTPMGLGYLAVRMARKHKIPLVSTFQTFFAHPRYLRHVHLDYSWAERAAWSFANWFNNRCDVVTCPSRIAAQELKQQGTKTALEVISNGIDLSSFDNRDARKMKKKYNPKGKLLLSVGRIAHEKNILFLLDCFDDIRKQMKSAKLILVGGGPQMQDVRTFVRKRRLADAVISLGPIPYERFIRSGIIGACDLFLTASDTETQGIVVLEAQANGLVCVGVDGGAVPELIRHKKNGYVVPAGDKDAFIASVVSLLTDRRRRDRYRMQALRDVKEHSMDRILNQWERLYRRVLYTGTKKPRRRQRST